MKGRTSDGVRSRLNMNAARRNRFVSRPDMFTVSRKPGEDWKRLDGKPLTEVERSIAEGHGDPRLNGPGGGKKAAESE